MTSIALEALRDAVARFVDERLVPAEAATAEHDDVSEALLAEMRELGLFGMTVPERYGGLGLDAASEVELVFELGRASPAFRSRFGTNNGIGSQGLIMNGTEEQRERYLPDIASGALITSFCLTEPDSGSDAASLKTTARKVDGGYLLNGTKRYITNAPQAGLFTVLCRTSPDGGTRGISALLVERAAPGLSVGRPDHKMGQHGSHTADVSLDDCFVPDRALLGGVEGQGFATAMKVLDRGRLHIAALCVGAARRLLSESLSFGCARSQFGQRIVDFQLIQAMLADSYAEMAACRALVRETARRLDAGEKVSIDTSSAKMLASEMVGRVADRAVQIHGGAGYMAEYAVERFYRDVRLFRLYEGTTQIQQLVIARNLIANA
ncbi:MAG: acyl-CoA dehydrogenase family protein [Pseudorhodoplanes sp.]|nr:acyl-CoA dehydrogenase family protein [Pseudorhodoplanes sp.]